MDEYVSCIKINKKPILPPLITPEKSLELENYKSKAIELEMRLKFKNELKTFINRLDAHTATTRTLEHIISFDTSQADTLNALNISKTDELPFNDNTETVVPLTNENSKKVLNLSCNTFDVAEYSDKGIVLFNNLSNLEASSIELDLNHSYTTEPRSRSNSYTLEAPSPFLLQCLKRNSINIEDSRNYSCDESHSSGIVAEISNVRDVDIQCDCDDNLKFGQNDSQRNCDSNETEIFDAKCNNSLDLSSLNVCNSELLGTPEKLIESETISDEIDIVNNDQKLLCCEVPANETLETPSTLPLIDFESDYDELLFYDSNSNRTISELAPNYEDLILVNCSRELFFEDSEKEYKKSNKEWAATILTAAVRGYLVRRLKRTERVTNLIKTIQEALLCAMSLHTENNEAIRPPDVELHRRLIQQVSAACYEFYNIFFNLTVKEQMALISLDRQRLLEKSKRPKSVESAKSKRSIKSNLDLKQRRSLAPSFAA